VQQSNVTDYLSKKQKESPKDLATEWSEIEELHNKKLWHQLTLKMLAFIKKARITKRRQSSSIIQQLHPVF